MAPYPTHEAFTPLLLAAVMVAFAALLLPPLAAQIAGGRRTLAGLASMVFALGLVAGIDVLDPQWLDTKLPIAGVLLGFIGAGATLWQWRETKAGGSAALGLALGAIPLVLFVTLEHATVLEDPTEASESQASWRRRLSPWDPEAMLALAWVAQRGEHLDIAQARLDLAVELGADEAYSNELDAELKAGGGDCDAAREAFDRAMAIRAERALETFDLRLDQAYRLPETFVRLCGLQDTAAPANAVAPLDP